MDSGLACFFLKTRVEHCRSRNIDSSGCSVWAAHGMWRTVKSLLFPDIFSLRCRKVTDKNYKGFRRQESSEPEKHPVNFPVSRKSEGREVLSEDCRHCEKQVSILHHIESCHLPGPRPAGFRLSSPFRAVSRLERTEHSVDVYRQYRHLRMVFDASGANVERVCFRMICYFCIRECALHLTSITGVVT